MVCYIFLQHNDHNIVSSSLETHEIILKYSNLFDFDQLLISTQIGSIEEIRVTYSTYQRWFIEMNDEFDSTSMINNEKRTSVAKLVHQLYFFPIRYILNMDGTIKSDDESRITVKCATPTYITYLLSLYEYGDLHLRGTCANLLVTLIQTTIHLLTLSSLSNSFNNSFINQCSLVSTHSQDSSRIELLEDSIQHTTSSCILAKFALAQLIDDIDFRILTYLEQQ
ncbi:unnamed protein product [Rotaria sp. Silwood1]|nr:unnamed protein product [Rotaria sp. Silwood1]CAF1646313.1 unnamed protein product [Rotaria sp. Silwood1]